jgi:hypothetical protein
MKKFLIAAVALATLAATVTPSYADNSEEVIIGVMGGVIGGLVLGEVLERPRYAAPAPVRVYEYDEPYMVRECVTKYKRYYDSNGNWVRRPVKRCYWVEQY